jgi:cellulose 1,4-beta-cellobiosidase
LVAVLAAPVARAEARVDNPFVGASWYLNPDYTSLVAASAAQETDATLKAQLAKVASYPTAVWLDRIAAIQGGNGRSSLTQHLDAALAQRQGETPVLVMLVIYNLPGRDCSALASNGELGPTDLARYKTEYIDVIASLEGDPKYAGLRIVNVIEIDSLPNLVTNTNVPLCATMKSNGNYVAGIQYALSKLHSVATTNTYNYIDAAHHGWIGWDDNFNNSAQLFADTAKGATGGVDTVQGFITNTANYSALVEPYLTLTEQIHSAKWIDFNRYLDERSFAVAFRNKLVSLGFNSKLGMLIDTSRNGWGGAARPTGASTASDVNTMVNQSRIDRRIHAGNWCNQEGAGLGERPQSVGADGIHAYVWVKPPGESDGASKEIVNTEGKGFDRMCDPTYTGNARNGNSMTGAMADAPISGQWFHAQLVALVKNANPPVPANGTIPPVGDFQLTASPPSLSLNQGETGTSTITVAKSAGFSGAVELSASGLPSGVTAVFAPPSTSSTSALTLTASSSAATGLSSVTITGKSGAVTHTTTVSLTVNTQGSPSFGLSATPASLAVDRGASASTTVGVSPSGGFSGSVALAAQGVPAGVTAVFSPASTTSTSSLTFTAAATALAGQATVTVVGTSGALTKATTVVLTVNASGGAPGFSLSPTPGTVSVVRGGSASTSVALTALGGFSGSAALTASGLPSGVSVAFVPNSVTAGTPSTATFTASSAAATGTSPITITGSGGGATGTTEVWLVVTASGSGTGGGSGSGGGTGNTGGGTAGTGGGTGRDGGLDGGDGDVATGGCGCGATSPSDLLLGVTTVLGVLALRRRRASRSTGGSAR